jgi:RNA polymerase sigma factor (sigma-70 family)
MIEPTSSTLQDDLMNNLIKQFNDGDERAWQFIMDSYGKRLQAICINSQLTLHMDIDVAQAEDITQEAWVILYSGCMQGKNHFENIGQIIKWMRETQHNLLRNLRRKASTRNEKPMKEDDNGETLLPSAVLNQAAARPVEESVIRKEDATWIWAIYDQVLDDFDHVDQDIVTRRIILNEKSSVIAKAKGKSVDHVYRVTERAWTKLKSYAHAESFFLQVLELSKRRADEE